MNDRLDFEVVNNVSLDTLIVRSGENFSALSVAEVSELIEVISNMRNSVLPAVPLEPSTERQYVVETSPQWEFVQNPLFDGLIFFFRHSGVDWQGFGLPRESLALLAESLTRVNNMMGAVH